MSETLNQIVALEKGLKSRVDGVVNETYKSIQKHDLFAGVDKSYRALSLDDSAEQYPPEVKLVVMTSHKALSILQRSLSELHNVTYRREFTNQKATADVVVDGKTLLSAAPVTFLLYLEKKVVDWRTMVDKLPVLDPAKVWSRDGGQSVYRTAATVQQKTKKKQIPVKLCEATVEHPAQCQLVTEDIVVGHWDTVSLSGAIPESEKDALIERANKLIDAIKKAREKANELEVPAIDDVGQDIFAYLLNK